MNPIKVAKLWAMAASAVGLVTVASAAVTLPEDYLYCDYVKSSGSQYVDTGIEAQGGLRVDTTLSESQQSAPVYVLGAAKEDKDDSHGTGSGYVVPVGFDAGNPSSLRVLSGTGYRPSAAVGFAEKTDISVFLATSGAAEYVISGGHNSDWRKDEAKTEMSDDCYGRNLYLFALNENGSASGFSKTTLYSMKIYTGATGLADGTLARDFIPCQKKDGAVYGLWDTVEGVFYAPVSGTLSGRVSDPQPTQPEEPVVEPIDTGATENWPDAVSEKVTVDGSEGGDLGMVAVHGAELAAYLAKDNCMDHGATGSTSLERPKPIAVTVGSTTLYYDNLLLGEKKEFAVGNVSGFFTVDATPPRTLAVPVNAAATTFVANVRDLGGWPLIGGGAVKQGLFFRGGNLDDFNKANAGADNFLVSKLGIKTEIDLRGTSEGDHAGPAGVTRVEAPFHGVNEQDPYGWQGDYNQGQIKTVFSTLGTEGALPAYIHCTIGRDRTGLIAQLLLQLAGVAEADVYRDYFTSLFAAVNGADDDIQSGAKVAERIAWLQNGADGLVLGEKFGDTLAGLTREYLEAIGVTAEELARITDALTGETPDAIISRVNLGVTASRADGAFVWTGGSERTTKYWEDAENWDKTDTYPSSAATVNIPNGTWEISALTDFSADDLTAKFVDFDSSSRTVFSGGRNLVFSGQVAESADNFFNAESGNGFRLEVTGAGTALSLENTNATFGYRIRNCTDATFLASAGGALTINGAYFGGGGEGTAGITGILMEATGAGSVVTFGFNAYTTGIKGDGVVFAATDGGELVFKSGKSSGTCTFAKDSSPNCGIRVDNGTFTCKTAIDIGRNADAGQFVTVQGANPSLTSTGDIKLGGGTGGLAFTLMPEKTWSADAPRVLSEKTLKVGSTATFTVDLANLTLELGESATMALLGGATLTLNKQPTLVNGGTYRFGTAVKDNVLYLAVTNSAERLLVIPPEIASKPYTGEPQVADVAESAQYTVVENKGGTDAGIYPVVLRLTDPTSVWDDEGQTTDDKTLYFVITPPENVWTVYPKLSKFSWKAGEKAGEIIATPASGSITVRYDVARTDVMPTSVGNHMAYVSVEGGPDYGGLAPVALAFTIFPATPSDGSVDPALACVGGDEVYSVPNMYGGEDYVHVFTTTGADMTLTVPDGLAYDFEYLVVAGGGAGGAGDGGKAAGGGGAGGLLHGNLPNATGVWSIRVGAGGEAPANASGKNGEDSFLRQGNVDLTAIGGGGGSVAWGDQGSDGGSGGGRRDSNAQTRTSGVAGQGHAGGHTGGGGAGSEAFFDVNKVDYHGGDGLAFDISGESKAYAQGGNGGIAPESGSVNKGVPGEDGTGNGGGGGYGFIAPDPDNFTGGAGGSGVVIVRYSVTGRPLATGGDRTYEVVNAKGGKDIVHVFTTLGAATFRVTDGVTIENLRYLVVAGGGAGGAGDSGTEGPFGGGGGAGGLLQGVLANVSGEWTVTVGAGGQINTWAKGGNGENSSVAQGETLVTALGGGGGGSWSNGKDGGSGGGAGLASSFMAGGKGTEGQGHDGSMRSGGGGAGAAATSEIGGAGLTLDITGQSVTYATGGTGGAVGVSGADNTGNGGGGGKGWHVDGGNGGSGIVVLRYEKPAGGDDYVFSGFESELPYTGEQVVQEVVVTKGEATLVEGTDYDVTYGENLHAGPATMAFVGKGDYADLNQTLTFSVIKAENSWVSGPGLKPSAWKVGSQPGVPVGTPKFGSVSSVSYEGADEPSGELGTHEVTFTVPGTDDYEGLVTTVSYIVSRFDIDPNHEPFCVGGDEAYSIFNANGQTEFVHVFRTTGKAMTFTVPEGAKISRLKYLVVAGGGAGGNGDSAASGAVPGGGGGAGGLLHGVLKDVSGTWTVTVGAGGLAALNNGEDSSLAQDEIELTAIGGGGGCQWGNGKDGGSGGGAGVGNNYYTPGKGVEGQGHDGSMYSGGGGAGAAADSAVGGAGLPFDITGETVEYAVGGTGGLVPKVDGAPSTGNGGSGGLGSGTAGGNGGSGIVVLRYKLPLGFSILVR